MPMTSPEHDSPPGDRSRTADPALLSESPSATSGSGAEPSTQMDGTRLILTNVALVVVVAGVSWFLLSGTHTKGRPAVGDVAPRYAVHPRVPMPPRPNLAQPATCAQSIARTPDTSGTTSHRLGLVTKTAPTPSPIRESTATLSCRGDYVIRVPALHPITT